MPASQDESEDFDTKHWPNEIRYSKEDKTLTVDFDDGSSFIYPAIRSAISAR